MDFHHRKTLRFYCSGQWKCPFDFEILIVFLIPL